MYKYLQNPKRSKFIFLSAIFLTTSFLIKQQVIWLMIAFLVAIIAKFGISIKKNFLKNLTIVAIPFLIFLIPETISFWRTGTLNDFLYWTFYFPFIKSSQIPGYILLPTSRQLLVVLFLLFLFLPAELKLKKENKPFLLSGYLLVFFAYPRFDYFHLVPALSILSIVFGKNISLLKKANILSKTIFIISFVFLTVFSVRFLQKNWGSDIRFFENDIYKTSSFLKIITEKNEPIYIQNGPDQILALSERLPTKPWADDFPWYLELNNIQDKVLKGLIEQKPRYIVSKPYDQGDTFGLGSYRPAKIADYIDTHYRNIIQISDTLWLKEKI